MSLATEFSLVSNTVQYIVSLLAVRYVIMDSNSHMRLYDIRYITKIRQRSHGAYIIVVQFVLCMFCNETLRLE